MTVVNQGLSRLITSLSTSSDWIYIQTMASGGPNIVDQSFPCLITSPGLLYGFERLVPRFR